MRERKGLCRRGQETRVRNTVSDSVVSVVDVWGNYRSI